MDTKEILSMMLAAAHDDYPNAWMLAESWRQDRGKDLPHWPDYCFFPMAGWYAAVCDELKVSKLGLDDISEVPRLAALGAWRYTQSIYRINPALYAALVETVPKGDLPVELLMRMPEWCVYIETPGINFDDIPVDGFFAHLEWDANTGSTELRLLLDSDEGLIAVPLHLGKWTITEAVDRAVGTSKSNAEKGDIDFTGFDDVYIAKSAAQLYPLISLLLYVCSDGVEYRAQNRPQNPEPKRTRRKGWKLFAAPHPRVWNLGDKIGEELEKSEREIKKNDGERKEVRPHIRRAHWHTFYAGPRDSEREIRVKWIPPLLVASSE